MCYSDQSQVRLDSNVGDYLNEIKDRISKDQPMNFWVLRAAGKPP